MQHLSVTVALLFVLVGSANAQLLQPEKLAAKPQSLFRHATVDAAWQTAQKTGKPMLVFVTSGNCHYCTKMVRETWSHPQIARAVSARYEPAILSKDSNPKLIKQLGIRAFPTTLVVSPEGKLVTHLQGFAEPQKFVNQFLRPHAERRLSAQPVSHQR